MFSSFKNTGNTPVSYTHLDVYKRQPLGGFFISIFIGWYLDKKIVWEEVCNNGTLRVAVYKLLIFILKYIAPIGIALIFINELGFLK